MIKKQHLMIIALIALIAFIAMPVQAYTCYLGDASCDYLGTMYQNDALSLTLTHSEMDAICTADGKGTMVTGYNYPTWTAFGQGASSNVTENSGYIGGSEHPANQTWNGYTFSSTRWTRMDSRIEIRLDCTGATDWAYGYYNLSTGSPTVAPVSSFTCTPTSQYPDTSVVCTDSSTNTPTDWYWTIDAEAMGIDAWQTSTSRNFTWESHYPGFYSVNLRANNSAGSDWENKSNYVSISVNATPNNCDIEPVAGYVRTYAQTNDGMTSGGIFNSDIQMKDVEGSAWSNVTNSGGWWCIDTLPGHSLNLYAQATGYTDVESIGVSANGGRHYLVMWPDYIPTPSAGNVTLYALVYDQQTGAPLYMSTVRVDGNTINTIMKNTGPEGQTMFTIKNDTSIHVTASKTGYTSITKVLTTSHLGPDTIMISLPRTSTTATATATPTPSWMTPSTTVDPRTSTQKDSAMMDLIRDNGEALIGLAIITTMLGLMKMWGK